MNRSNFFLLLLATFVLCATTLQYDVGTAYEYRYVTTIRLTEPRPEASNVVFQVSGLAEVRPVWRDKADPKKQVFLLKMTPQLFVKPRFKDNLEDHPSPLDSTPFSPVLFTLDSGRVTQVFANPDEDPDVLNLKRGIVSLFQLQDITGDTTEVDAAGKCKVQYKVSGRTTTKIKKNCRFASDDDSYHSHRNKVLAAKVKVYRDAIYQLTADDFIIQSAESNERVHYEIQSLPDLATTVISKQKLSLLRQNQDMAMFEGNFVSEVVSNVAKIMNIDRLASVDLSLSNIPRNCTANCKSFSEVVKDRKETLSNKRLSTLKGANGFLQTLRECRKGTKLEIMAVLQEPKNKNILSSLFDIAASAQTTSAFQAAVDLIPNIHSTDIIERFLLALAVSAKPNPEIITGLQLSIEKRLFKDEKVEQTAILVLGSLIHVHCNKVESCPQPASDAIKFLSNGLERCSDDTCHVTYLRALRNAARPETIPMLVTYVSKPKTANLAMQAIKAMPTSSLNNEIKLLMWRIYNQLSHRYDTTTRLHAADILLSADPSQEQVDSVADGLGDVNEFSTYLSGRLREIREANDAVRERLTRALMRPSINNYNVLAQPGISTAFTNLLAEKDDVNATYGIHLELAKGGLLKQSVFDVGVNNIADNLNVLSFGMFASGLSSLSGDVEETPEEDAGDATAGIELGVMGVWLRPYVFFVGQTELMGHIWSGTASEPTNIIQGNLLLHDTSESVALQSGFVVSLRAMGSLSLDMSGSLQVSLWNRNSHSEIVTKGAMLIQGVAKIETGFIEGGVETTTAAETSLSFVTDNEFYEAPFKTCTQMVQPDFPVRSTVRKMERIPGGRHRIRRTLRRTKSVAGKCYALHPKNSALCSNMLK